MVQHVISGLRIGGSDLRAEWLEVSLPRLRHGDNGRMIKDQSELNRALAMLDERILDVCEPGFDRVWPCSRLDVVGQFIINLRDVITAHRECSHPAIRKGKVYYEGESLAFRGKERLCRIYDKIKEVTGKPGTVTRVEWQLRGDSRAVTSGGTTSTCTISRWRTAILSIASYVCGSLRAACRKPRTCTTCSRSG